MAKRIFSNVSTEELKTFIREHYVTDSELKTLLQEYYETDYVFNTLGSDNTFIVGADSGIITIKVVPIMEAIKKTLNKASDREGFLLTVIEDILSNENISDIGDYFKLTDVLYIKELKATTAVDNIPILYELRVYEINKEYFKKYIGDEEFIALAEQTGKVYTYNNFMECVPLSPDSIYRIYCVPVNNEELAPIPVVHNNNKKSKVR